MSKVILPKTTLPPEQKIPRQHSPAEREVTVVRGYHSYRECLRWEFGFSCAFCLLHEADLHENREDGPREMWVEHWVTQHKDRSLANSYTNCLLSCEKCNLSRGKKPTMDAEGRKLLEPMRVAWADHFDANDGKLIPKTRDAEFTANMIYRINEKHKVRLRKQRREVISKCLQDLQEGPEKIRCYLERTRQLAHNVDDKSREIVAISKEAAALWSNRLRESRETLERYRLIPTDARSPCACGEQNPRPATYLERQAIHVRD